MSGKLSYGRPDGATRTEAHAPCSEQQSVFSIDVEDWFNLSGTGHEPPPSEWDRLESRVERNFMEMLDLLAETSTSATCFFLDVAKVFGHPVREAVSRRHEAASHG